MPCYADVIRLPQCHEDTRRILQFAARLNQAVWEEMCLLPWPMEVIEEVEEYMAWDNKKSREHERILALRDKRLGTRKTSSTTGNER